MSEIDYLRDVIWLEGDPFREEACVFCEESPGWGAREHPTVVHMDDCPWLLEWLRRERLGLVVGPEYLRPPKPRPRDPFVDALRALTEENILAQLRTNSIFAALDGVTGAVKFTLNAEPESPT